MAHGRGLNIDFHSSHVLVRYTYLIHLAIQGTPWWKCILCLGIMVVSLRYLANYDDTKSCQFSNDVSYAVGEASIVKMEGLDLCPRVGFILWIQQLVLPLMLLIYALKLLL